MATTSLIDTNVLVYAFNPSAPFHLPAREIVEKALNGDMDAAIADKNLYEFYAIVTDARRVQKPVSIEKAIELIELIQNSQIKLVYSARRTVTKALELAKAYQIFRQEVFDLVLVAIMLENNIQTIVTANDKHFGKIKEIAVINPFKP